MTDLSADMAETAAALAPWAGYRVALIAPAGGLKDERIDQVCSILEAAGIEACLGDHARDHHRYLAGTREDRLADLYSAFEQPDIAAVWCLRGGYGSAHLLESLDWSRIPADVPLIGHSDITALLEAWRQRERPAIHGPGATDMVIADDDAASRTQRVQSIHSLTRALEHIPVHWPLQPVTDTKTAISGELVGGNLTTLASLAGTPAALTLRGPSILLLEDVGEAEFRLERCFHQLLQTLDPSQLQAVCLGHFERCRLADGLDSLAGIFREWLEPLGTPLLTGAPIGHGPINHAWRVGQQARWADGWLSS